MPKDENMDVRIAILETKVDDLLGKVATLRQEMATKSDIANLQMQLDLMQRQLDAMQRQLDAMQGRLDGFKGEIERVVADAAQRLDQRLEFEIKSLASKAELEKAVNKALLKGIAIQTAINVAMISVVVQFLR